jgi:zinc protease
VALLLLLLALPARAAVFSPTSFTLANGLQVVVVANHRAPIVTQMVFYKVGAADDPVGKSGAAHFLEHLMFRGTASLGPGRFSLEVAKVGGDENAYTTDDYTVYHETVAVEQLPLVMRLESDRMANLAITDAVVGPEREVILEERRQRIDNDPGAQLGERLRAALFLNHPYRRPTIGWEHEMRGLTAEDERTLYRRWYAPNNAVLVIAGDVDPAAVRALAERYFGPIAARPVPPRERLAEPPPVAPRQVTLSSGRVQQPAWSLQYQAPSYRGAPGGQAYALELLSQILGGGTTSRLYRRLVVEDKVASAAGTAYDPDVLDNAVFAFFASPPAGGSAEAVGRAVAAEIDRLLRDGVSEDELARAKALLQASAIKARDSLKEPARIIGATLATGGTIDELERWPERIGAVTKAEMEAAAHAVLRPEAAVTGLLLPKPTS